MGNQKQIVVIGAGPAGLTAALELLRETGFHVVVLESSGRIGGISATVACHGNRMDLGGHRLFSKSSRVLNWWEEMLPVRESGESGMHRCNRISHIWFNRHFFDYPITLSWKTLRSLGPATAVQISFSYLHSRLFRQKEESLEDFYINRFGRKLYSMFFENYTANVWGRHPSRISPDWGSQRVKGLSVGKALKTAAARALHISQKKEETSLISSFLYPSLGPGQLWEAVVKRIEDLGGEIRMNTAAVELKCGNSGRIEVVRCRESGGRETEIPADAVFSSAALQDIVRMLPGVPDNVREIAEGLPYRSLVTVGVLIRKAPEGGPLCATLQDNWIYIHDPNVRMGRMQLFGNWSRSMVRDPEHTVWLGTEYFCDEGDSSWRMSDAEWHQLAVRELAAIGMIDSAEDVLETHVERVAKAYPAYFDTYGRIGELRTWLDTVPNLYCIGRNGQHRYNNIDHSMLTAFEAVSCLKGTGSRNALWNVNTESDYLEENPGVRKKGGETHHTGD